MAKVELRQSQFAPLNWETRSWQRIAGQTQPQRGIVMSAVPMVPQLTGKAPVVARMLGVSPSTVRRLSRKDPEFPKPFRLSQRGDLLWPLAEIPAYVRRKAAEPAAA